MKKIYLFSCISLLLGACDSSNLTDTSSGILGLTPRELSLEAGASEHVITTENNHYWYIAQGLSIINSDTTVVKCDTYLDTDPGGGWVDVTMFKDTLYGEWFTAIKKGYDLQVKVEENKSGKERKLQLTLGTPEPTDRFSLVQKGK